MKKTLIVLISTLILSACQATPKLYYWGDYTNTLVDYTVSPNDETLQEHKAALNDIVQTSHEENKKVPPTIYFKLGVIELNAGNGNYKKFFEKEKSLYPESITFVDFYANKNTRGVEK